MWFKQRFGSHQLVGSSTGPGSPLPASDRATSFRFSGITDNCSEVPGGKKRQNSGEPKDYRRSALTFPLLNSSSGDEMDGRGTLTGCSGCARSGMEWSEKWNNLLRLGGGSSMTGNSQEWLPAHLAPPSWPQITELILYCNLQHRKQFLSQKIMIHL